MELQIILNFVLGGVSTVLGWFARELWSAVKELKRDLTILREDLPIHYIRKEDFRDFREELLKILYRIETKIDGKQDKL